RQRCDTPGGPRPCGLGSFSACGGCGPHLLEWDARLLTQRAEVEVDLLAGHQPLAERHDIRERHREATAARSDAKPVATARPVEGSPHRDDVVAESHGLVLGS